MKNIRSQKGADIFTGTEKNKAVQRTALSVLEVTPGFEPPWGGLASC